MKAISFLLCATKYIYIIALCKYLHFSYSLKWVRVSLNGGGVVPDETKMVLNVTFVLTCWFS